ncbi:protein draper-like isoform X3 [Ostrea edulis]|uniref:protein draper-like isoform X3 n=1 Tax=Ostrea edulis TaxID=37623 RepID=UPI0024AFEAA4|nr:protein draper-like isoform X3 [Ostrea edulis]
MVIIICQILLCVIYTTAYENAALRKPAWQTHNWPDAPYDVEWGAAKAVDGMYTDRSAGGNQCTQSGPGQTTAMWRVDLESVVSISHINIYYRTENKPSPGAYYNRFAGFFLYVSNTTSKDDGHRCFHEIQPVTGTPVENQTISCSVHGRYVIYYNERKPGVTYPSYYSRDAYNELCEVEVHVCDKQAYGLGCSSSCGNCSDGEPCHYQNGTCPRGCNAGVYGEKCQIPCQTGFYGKNCGHRCSENCEVTNRCSRFTGECDGGCKPGWKMPTCQRECDDGMYGAGCTQKCGSCLDNKQCHHVNGTCLNGCSSGYQGGHCKENCPSGYFGINCENSCTVHCGRNGSCDQTTGICDGGCEEGWSGPLCGTEELSSRVTSCTDDNTATIISIVVSIFIVLIGSIINFLMWKRNQTEYAKKGENCRSETRSAHNSDIPSGSNRVESPYAELGDRDKPNTYEELHHYTDSNGKV